MRGGGGVNGGAVRWRAVMSDRGAVIQGSCYVRGRSCDMRAVM